MDWPCSPYATNSPTQDRTTVEPRWAKETRPPKRNLEEDRGEETERKGLDLGVSGTPSSRS